MARFLIHWLTIVIALAVTNWLLPGVRVTSTPALLFAALAIGLVNALVRPVLVLLTLPLTVLTLGLFYLVVNGLAFGLAAALVSGFSVDSFWWAMLGAFVLGFVSWMLAILTGAAARH